jgi:uncharacterized protein GlcG (DUF336 family)
MWPEPARLLIAPLLALGLAAGAGAQELPREAVLPLDLARDAAQAAIEACAGDGWQVSAAVVDRGGTLKALLRADGAGPHTTDSSFKKAYTSASLGRSTADYAPPDRREPGGAGAARHEREDPPACGGLPIRFDDEIVGGIGVGGAPGGHLDEACARAGLDAIGAD